MSNTDLSGVQFEDLVEEMIRRLEDPDYITRTFDVVLPTFLRLSVEALRPEAVPASEMMINEPESEPAMAFAG